LKYDKVLVTGGAGFVGSHTADELLKEGSKVWVLDDLSTGFLGNLRAWKGNPRFHFQRGTVTNYRKVLSLVGRVDAIVHLAAIVSPLVSIHRPEVTNEINVTGTLNVLRATLKTGVRRVVYASSSSVYGNQTHLPIAETNPLQPITPYGTTKLAGEKYCGAFYASYGLETISLRYFNVYGTRQSANPYSGVIAIFASRLHNGLRPVIYGDGTQTRDFIHVSDVVRANLLALGATRGLGEVFNIGTGIPTSVLQLHSVLARVLGKPESTTVHRRPRPGDIRHSFSDTTKARHILRFRPGVELLHGLEGLVLPAGNSLQYPHHDG